jgi:predicted acylesterase/phospholipase RssA
MSTEKPIDPERMNPGVNALILSGGGANGAYEIGVLKALTGGASPATNHKPVSPRVVTGTSIGAFNAAALVSRLREGALTAVSELEKIWTNQIPREAPAQHNYIFRFRGDPFQFLTADQLLANPLVPFQNMAQDSVYYIQNWLSSLAGALKSNGGLVTRLAGMIDFSAVITNEPSTRLVRASIDPARIRESSIELRIASTNWDTGVVRVFENADLSDDCAVNIVLSSTAIPGLFPPVLIDGDSYVDGGVIMNTPLLPALRALRELHERGKKPGAEPDTEPDTLHLIYLDPDVKSIPVSTMHSSLDTLMRMFTVQFASKINQDISRVAMVNRSAVQLKEMGAVTDEQKESFKKVAGVSRLRPVVIHRYHPRDDLGNGILGWLDFKRERIERLIDRGYRDAVEHDCRRSGCVFEDGVPLTAPPQYLEQ